MVGRTVWLEQENMGTVIGNEVREVMGTRLYSLETIAETLAFTQEDCKQSSDMILITF
jgi:hypothetical protein